jgi:hypothetical protein
MSYRPTCKFFQQGRCTRGDSCSFSHSGAGGGGQQQQGPRGPTVPSGALPSMNGKLTRAAAEFWFPECRECECCKGFKHGCPCCVPPVSVCSCSAPSASGEGEGEQQQQGSSAPALPASGLSLPPPPAAQQQRQQRQPQVVVDLPPGTHILSIDVECAATSLDHNGRAVCSVGVVDEYGRPLLSLLVKPGPKQGEGEGEGEGEEGGEVVPVLSYLTPLTGVTREDVEARGVSLQEGLARLRALLTPNTVLVGQNLLKDVQWLGLRQGQHFGSLIDLASLFRVWNDRLQTYTGFSQDHVARVWLGVQDRPSHDALQDAGIAMALFNAYRNTQWDAQRLQYMQGLTMNTPRAPSLAARTGAVEGCCLGHRKTCTCGGAFAQQS